MSRQNGTFFMTERVDGDEGDLEDEFENLKKLHLQNGHRKHPQRPRNSLHEFEQMENLLQGQNGFANDDRFDPDASYRSENDRSRSEVSRGRSESSSGGSGERRGKSERSDRETGENSLENSFRSSRGEENGSECDHQRIQSREASEDSGDEVQALSLSDGAPPDEDQDPSSDIIMMKYMEETPRAIPSGMHANSHFSDQSFESNSNSNNNKTNNVKSPQTFQFEDAMNHSRISDNMVSPLSQEQPPSHLEEVHDHDEEDSVEEQSELGDTVIPAGLEEVIKEAALNVQEFGSDPDEHVQSESSVNLGQFKPIAADGKRAKKPSSRRSSRGTTPTRDKLSPQSAEKESAFVPYEDSLRYPNEAGVLKGDREAAELQARLSQRIPTLNLEDVTDTEAESDTPRSKEELSSRLTEERKTRRQATKVNHQLQMEYDELLAKYALAENTIDQLRLGAKVNLYSDPPPKGQSFRGRLTPSKQPVMLELGGAQRAQFSDNLGTSRNQSEPSQQKASHRLSAHPPTKELQTQTVAQDMKDSVASLAQQVPLLERAIDTNQVPVEEQQALFEQLKRTHSKLEEEYMQQREDAKEQQRWNSVLLDSEEDQFDPEKSLEGQIFQVGMQLEDLQEKVEENIRQNPVTTSTPSIHSGRHSAQEDIPKRAVHPQVTQEYNHLLEKYEALKHLPATPKRDKEIQRLVKEIDNLQMTSKDDDDEVKYLSERSDWSDTPNTKKRSSRRKGNGSSSGRGTPSSAHSLEERKTTTKGENQRRKLKTDVKPLGPFPRKQSDPHIDSGSSHPRSPEHEVDSGFVGSEGSRQSQKSKQSNIPRNKLTTESHRSQPEAGYSRHEKSRLRRAQHHTPIQELSERGQYSSSQSGEGKRRSQLPSRKSEPVTVTSEEDEGDSYETPVRISRRLATPSRQSSQSHQHQILSPLPTKPKLQDFQRKSEMSHSRKSTPSANPDPIQSKGSPEARQRERNRAEIASLQRTVQPKMQKAHAAPADPRLQRSRSRRGSDVPSSLGKSVKSVKSEELLALKEELAGLKRQMESPQNGKAARSKSIISESEIHPGVREGEEQYLSADEGYMEDTSPEGYGRHYDRSSVKSSGSSKSEQLAELRAEVAQLKQDLRGSEAANRSGHRSLPLRTSTSRLRGKYPNYNRQEYPSVARVKASPGERDSLRETLRKQYIPTSRSRRQMDVSELPEGDNLNLEYLGSRRLPRSRNNNNSIEGQGYVRDRSLYGDDLRYSGNQTDGKYNPLSSMEQQPQRHARFNTTTEETSSPCEHCNGSGVHQHTPVKPNFAHHSSIPVQQGPNTTTYVETSPNRTVYIPSGTPLYHSTPAVVQTAGGHLSQNSPASGVAQQPFTLIGNPTLNPPQGGVSYVNHPSTVPLTVLSSSPMIHSVPPAVTVSPPQTLTSPGGGVSTEGARPVYLVPSSKGRYYIRDEPHPEEESDVEEIIYRRTPVRRSGSRKSRKVEVHSQIEVEDDRELEDTLFAACRMAQKLKKSSEKVLESVQTNLQKSSMRRQLQYH